MTVLRQSEFEYPGATLSISQTSVGMRIALTSLRHHDAVTCLWFLSDVVCLQWARRELRRSLRARRPTEPHTSAAVRPYAQTCLMLELAQVPDTRPVDEAWGRIAVPTESMSRLLVVMASRFDQRLWWWHLTRGTGAMLRTQLQNDTVLFPGVRSCRVRRMVGEVIMTPTGVLS